ncbi:MAG: 2-aminobenzoate-CoA ligase [Rhodocyclaceae bacterium]|nr:2-aminobenzoate-CoA ligase [Rhodocyclaceae bacterium]HNQ58176.1 AMP-binding protein [Candidatus Desulfobacillus denitrificans]HNT63371.1 AMP-binding protein [Candidatus Desulfobacillus denitrificans]
MAATAHIDTFARDNLPPRAQWPKLVFERPELQYPGRLNCAAELLDRMVAAGHGDRPAIWAPVDGKPVRCTYRQLLAQANRIARALREDLGLVPGNRVLLRGPNNPMMAACWLGIVKAGGIVVATMPLLRAKELTQIAAKARCGLALCDARLLDELEEARQSCPDLKRIVAFNDDHPPAPLPTEGGDGGSLRSQSHTRPALGRPGGGAGSLEALLEGKPDSFDNVDTAADDVALIAFTSGTTGQPKGTMHFHRDVLAMCDAFPRSVLKPGPDDIFCGTPPLAFTFGLGGLLCFPLRFGASTVLVEKLMPDTLMQTIRDFKATICFTAPTFWRLMAPLARQDGVGRLKKCVSAGEALPDATRQLWKQASGIEIIDGIGATEMIHIFISSPPEAVRRGAIGKAVPGYRARIVDEDGGPLPPGRVGRLAVIGPTGCRYLADPRQSQYVQHGWNLTGDAFSMDADGYFFYQARTDDMIISAGYNIAGPEVESALLQHPAVAECGVVGVPDDERGQIVKAVVVLREGHAPGEAMAKALQDFVKQAIAPYKYPRAVEFADALPRTETGKLQRFKLRQQP